jgi:hypothetical protein
MTSPPNDRPRPLQVVPREQDSGTAYRVVREAPPNPAPTRIDRRQFARHALALRVQLRFETLDAAVHSESVDLSRSGIFLRTAIVRPLGTAVQLHFELEDHQLDIRGIIVRAELCNGRPTGMAIAFDAPLAASASIFDELIEQRAARAAR